jgi:CheY-like chemotaxis protein
MLHTSKPQVTVSQEGVNKPIAYVLDDEGPVGTLVSRMLSSLGYVPMTFTEMPQCLQQLKEATEYSKPALLVLDLALGKHDAVDVFDQLKALGFKGRLLLMSGVDETTLNEIQKICTARGLTAFAPLRSRSASTLSGSGSAPRSSLQKPTRWSPRGQRSRSSVRSPAARWRFGTKRRLN